MNMNTALYIELSFQQASSQGSITKKTCIITRMHYSEVEPIGFSVNTQQIMSNYLF